MSWKITLDDRSTVLMMSATSYLEQPRGSQTEFMDKGRGAIPKQSNPFTMTDTLSSGKSSGYSLRSANQQVLAENRVPDQQVTGNVGLILREFSKVSKQLDMKLDNHILDTERKAHEDMEQFKNKMEKQMADNMEQMKHVPVHDII